ncbi:MAG: nucleotidyltransferase domain-containing protein [Ginsengibacter sp.]
MTEIIFPTEFHKQSVAIVKDFFLRQKNVDTILLVNSLARGKGTADSDIDMAVLVSEATLKTEISALENTWQYFLNSSSILNQYIKSNRFAQLHLDIIDGIFEPAIWENGAAVDFFEVEIGNRLLYSKPLIKEGEYFKKLKIKWLPYYDDTLQNQRLQLAKEACVYDLNHIPLFVKRGLYFQAFDKLYAAFQKFLQTLFIKHKTYPIAYNKWIKDQVAGILKLPELYKELPGIVSVKNIESNELINKSEILSHILNQYC